MIAYPTIREAALELLHSLDRNYGHTAAGLRGMAASCLATVVTYPVQRWRVQSQAALPCRVAGIFDGLLFKLLHSGLSGFIIFYVMSGSNEILDLILG